jgi:hypothetical protein
MKNLEATVFPSEQRTILIDDTNDTYGGAHQYLATPCRGFTDGKTVYDYYAPLHVVQFVKKHDDGTVTPGLQSEQLVHILLDRHAKLNAKYPSAQYEKMKAGLEMFLEACKERVEERMARGVMGELKK